MTTVKPAAVPITAILLVSTLSWLSPARAGHVAIANCTVPGTHATIQIAVDDAACDSIDLTADRYVGSVTIYRSLTLTGAPSVIDGELTISTDGTAVVIDGVELGEAPMFEDGFESGDTLAWSMTFP